MGALAGLQVIVLAATLLANLEFWSLLFSKNLPRFYQILFLIFSLSIFGLCSWGPAFGSIGSLILILFYFIITLLFQNSFPHLEDLLSFQIRSLLGFFYVGYLPAMAMILLKMPQGPFWFLFTLIIVFAGDTGAYLAGSFFGKTRLMPSISPKKSFEGAVAGLLSSFVVGALGSGYLTQQPWWITACIACLAGLVAQGGDLFESLLKRVAQVKDSGKIMPGHGGVLDRIDGVLFATPLMLVGAWLLN
jgi:phosphatidate cytidylyltransferase